MPKDLGPELNLELVGTEELITEVLKRFDHCVLVGLKDDQSAVTTVRRYLGDYHCCMGLVTDMQHVIFNDIMDAEKPLEPFEDRDLDDDDD